MSTELSAPRRRDRALSAAEGRALVREQLMRGRQEVQPAGAPAVASAMPADVGGPRSKARKTDPVLVVGSASAPEPTRRSRVRPEPAADPRWRWLSTREAHRGRVRIDVDDVQLPTGEHTTFEVDRSVPFTVAVLVQDGAELLLARQYRYPIDRWILDLPGGAGAFGEFPEQAARREIEEELGVVAAELIPLHTFFANPGRSVWATHLFFAPGVHAGRASAGDPSEQVRAVRIPLSELDRLIAEGEILDPALLVARTMAAAKGLLPPVGA